MNNEHELSIAKILDEIEIKAPRGTEAVGKDVTVVYKDTTAVKTVGVLVDPAISIN